MSERVFPLPLGENQLTSAYRHKILPSLGGEGIQGRVRQRLHPSPAPSPPRGEGRTCEGGALQVRKRARHLQCLFVFLLLAFHVSLAFADQAGSQLSAFPDEEGFFRNTPLVYSYESGQWLSSKPGKIFTTGRHESGFTLPTLRGNPKPIVYPRWAITQGWEGQFVIAVEIREDGTVGRWKMMESTGHELLDQAAVKTVRQWRFEPAKQNGQPVISCIQIPIRFVLDDD